MPAKKSLHALTTTQIEGLVHVIRGQQVMLDSDLAELYGVSTGRLNEQVVRNIEKFPDDFSYELTQQEFEVWRTPNAAPRVHRTRRCHALRRAPVGDCGLRQQREHLSVRSHATIDGDPGELVSQLQQLAESFKLRTISEVLRKMLTPPPEPPKRRIGFHPSEPPTEAKS